MGVGKRAVRLAVARWREASVFLPRGLAPERLGLWVG